jgi:hypothetical protein
MIRLIVTLSLLASLAACSSLNWTQPPFPQQDPVTGTWGPDNTNP